MCKTIIHCLGICKLSYKPSETLFCQTKYGQAGISEVYLLFKKSICLVNHLVKVDVYGSTNTNKANIEKLWPIRDVFGCEFTVKKNPCCHAINWEKGVAFHYPKPISHETLAINLQPINEKWEVKYTSIENIYNTIFWKGHHRLNWNVEF